MIIEHAKRADLRRIADQIGDGKLSFGSPERLMTYLGVMPGSVSPFGLINDREHHVRVFLDRGLRSSARISFHPNINTITLTLAFRDFERFLASSGRESFASLRAGRPIALPPPSREFEKQADSLGNLDTIGEITIGCALGYLDFRYANEPWRPGHPKLTAWYEKVVKLAPLAETVPVG